MNGRPTIVFDRASILAFVTRVEPTVYRIWLDGELQYVGASSAPRRRLLTHLAEIKGDHVSLEAFRTTTAMARAEREAIANEICALPTGSARRHPAWKAQRR